MANMTFKASLLPNTNLGYSLGSSTQKWNIYGLITPAGTTAQFYRGDNTWSNTLTSSLNIAKAGECGIEVNNTQSTNPNQVAFIVGSSGNAGIYSRKNNKWIVYNTSADRTYLADSYNGTATALAYSQAGLAASAITWLTCWNGYELRAISKTEMANAVDSAHKWVRIGGDTMSGDLKIVKSTAVVSQVIVQNSTQSQVSLHMAAGGNQGVYSSGYWNGSAYTAAGKWLVYRGTDGNVNLNGNANTADKLRVARNIAIAGAVTGNANFDGSANITITTSVNHTHSSEALTNIALTWSSSYTTGDYMLIHNGETGSGGGQLFRAINQANTATWVDGAHKWVRIGGDTMTGNLTTQRGGESYFRAINTATSVGIYLDSDGPGNHGIWSNGYWNGSAFTSSGRWIIRRGTDNRTYIDGPLTINNSEDVALNKNGALIIGNASSTNIAIDNDEIEARNNGAASTLYLNHDGGAVETKWLRIINDSSNTSDDALLYVKHYSNNDYGVKVDKTGYNYGIYVKTTSDASRAIYTEGYITGSKVYGAVWNDYAEYRETKEKIEPGRCVCETGKGDLVLTNARLQEGCEIVSDTFGFAIGESEKCKTPTAATGRVLAYLYEDRELAKPGRPVCSGPDGTVSLMTNEEAREYPWYIIGTVSEIPNYEIWHAGSNGDQEIKVNGRIWIRIR